MYTLLPAMKGVTVSMLFQAIAAMEQRNAHPHLERHLLRLRTILRRSKTLSEQDKQRVEGKLKSYDSLLESDPELQKEIQEKAEVSKLEGKIEGKIEGKLEGKIEGRQQAVLDIVEIRFPTLLEVAQEQIVHLNDTNSLSLLTKQIILAPDEATARWALSTLAA
jgi:flagellar biosynthesis/type III secretory pathway protein FliH